MSTLEVTYAWVTMISYYIVAMEWVIFHWPVIKHFAPEDWLVRAFLFASILLIATSAYRSLHFNTPYWGEPGFALSGSFMVVGFFILIWKFRYHRDTAGLQPTVGTPPE